MSKMKKELLSALCIFIFSVFVSLSVSAAVLNVPGDYPTIQAAIDNATDGDTINVGAGVYNENIVINKSIELIGAAGATITASSGVAAISIIDTDGVKIEGFDITTNNVVLGIWIAGSSNTENPSSNLEIKNNDITINGISTGIYTSHSNPAHSDWLIQGNTIDSAGVNLELYDVKNVEVKENTFQGNGNSVSVVYASELSNVNNADFLENTFLGNEDVAWPGVIPTFWIESDFINWDGDSNVNDILIQGNKFYNWKNAGIRLGEPGGAGIFDNINNVVINYNGFYFGTGPAILNEVEDKIFDGTYNYWGSCDGPGPVGPGNGVGVSVNVTYSPWLGVCITNKTNATCAVETNNITLSADLNGTLIDSTWISYNINGTNYNKTASVIGNKATGVIALSELVGGQNITWNVYVEDSTGRVYNNSWKKVYVRKNTYLGVIPWPADGLNNWFITEPLFNLISDTLGINIYYQWDSTGALLYTAPFGLEDAPNDQNITGGIVELNWWTDFGACGNESEQNQIFKIDFTNPLITDLQPADGSTVINNLRPEISAYLDEVYQSNSGIDKGTVSMILNGIDVSADAVVADADGIDATVSYNPTFDLIEGENNVTIDVTDNAGRNSILTWFFNIEITPVFSMTVDSPQEQDYDNRRVQFNISLSDDVKLIEYINWDDRRPRWKRLCKNCDEYGLSRKKTKTLKEGTNNITIRAIDSFGQIKEENIVLFVDSKKPRISRIRPSRNSVINGSEFYIKYTENNLQKIELFWNPSQELVGCTAGKNQECTTSADLSAYEGNYIEYYFEVSDSVNIVQSKETKVKVDTISPLLTVNLPENQVYGRKVQFDVNASEDVTLEYIDNSASSPRWRRLCNFCFT